MNGQAMVDEGFDDGAALLSACMPSAVAAFVLQHGQLAVRLISALSRLDRGQLEAIARRLEES